MTRARHLSLVRPDGPRSGVRDGRDALVREIAAILASTTSFRGALPRTLDVLCRASGADAAHTWVRRAPRVDDGADAARKGDGGGPDPAEPTWNHLWHPDPPPAGYDGLRGVLFETEVRPGDRERRSGERPTRVEPGRSPVAADALGSRSVTRIDDVARLPGGEWKQGLLEAEVRGVLALPVFARERPVAVLELFFRTTLKEGGLPDGDTLFLVQSELERRAEYDRMRDAVERSARLWRSLRAGRETLGGADDGSSENGGGARVVLTPAGAIPGGARREVLYEGVTGLPSRALLLDRVEHTLARRTRQPDRRFALVVFDLELGAGGNGGGRRRDPEARGGEGSAGSRDDVVAAVGRQLRDNVRPGDSVGHLSPSCLAVLLEDVSDRSEAATVARRLEETAREEEFDLLATTGVRMRVGLALARPAHESAEDVADEALADAARTDGSYR